ncbi:MAG: flagellar basal-body rod protein FlgF [Alphaproteobacteria bacterium]|nr:flagellar basal-body rod protein FlgF [Alphaproteobacteria bacterium]
MSGAALSSLQVQMTLSRKMEIIADNLANMSTPGFKAEMLAIIPDSDGLAPSDQRFAVPLGIVRDTRGGNLTLTGNALDLAIQGKGYFVIQTPEGERYTRNGRFSLDAQGKLVNSNGLAVLSDSGGPISFPPEAGKLSVSPDGTISAASGEIATIGIVAFENEHQLVRISNGLFLTKATPKPAEKSLVIQGAVEESNVQAVIQITEMMKVTRGYQSAQKIIQTEHERLRRAIQSLTSTS